jgi:hypothetical protein
MAQNGVRSKERYIYFYVISDRFTLVMSKLKYITISIFLGRSIINLYFTNNGMFIF